MKSVKKLLYILFLTGWLVPFLTGLNFWNKRACEAALECSFPYTATALQLWIVAGIWFVLVLLKAKPWGIEK